MNVWYLLAPRFVMITVRGAMNISHWRRREYHRGVCKYRIPIFKKLTTLQSCVCVCVRVCVHAHVFACVRVSVCVCAMMCVCECVCVCCVRGVCVCEVCVCVCVCLCVYLATLQPLHVSIGASSLLTWRQPSQNTRPNCTQDSRTSLKNSIASSSRPV